MKQLAILALAALLTIGILACGTESAEPEATAAPASGGAQATEPPADPTNTPVPEPTAAPANTPVPADTPEPTATPVPEPTNTPVPEPTNTPVPEPEATEVPAATTPPEPAATAEPEATVAPDPTATPEPAPTETPALPIAADLASLGDNLLFVAYFDRVTQGWLVYDASGTFTPDQLPLPPDAGAPDPSDIGELTELIVGDIYYFVMTEGQRAVLNGRSVTFYQALNPLQWK